ncbi:ubiquinone/menaquinone biosynthesis methyltransferase [bacterium]|nr:ubiquinone/menaquinone biosynthesis methyltransferase [bacterium]
MTVFKTPEYIQKMFDKIAEKYDFMNNTMSFGLHKWIKKDCIEILDINPHSKVLDACTGTGDLAKCIQKSQPLTEIIGIDFSYNMLDIAELKNDGIIFEQGDITNLEFADNSFNFVTMGFGLRNISNPEKALSEIYRVLKPGGKFLHLDFGKKNFVSKIFDYIVPITTKIFGGDFDSYSYLIKSKNAFPEPEELIKDFEKSGFNFVIRKDYLFGTISMQIMKK